jgi:hypothetical protein
VLARLVRAAGQKDDLCLGDLDFGRTAVGFCSYGIRFAQ